MILSLAKALENIGLVSSDIVCVTSDISRLGIPDEARKEMKQFGSQHLLNLYVDTLKQVLGPNGTLLMPTFTYSACKGEIFNPKSTPSTVGALTEFFRKLPESRRTNHSIFSYAVWGKHAEDFLATDNSDCFGANTVFDLMCKLQGKYLMLGINMSKGATQVYYSEQKATVPYRYFKDFSGQINDGIKIQTTNVKYFVRDYAHNYSDSWENLELDSINAGITITASFNEAPIFIQNAKEIDDFIQKQLNNDPNYLIKFN